MISAIKLNLQDYKNNEFTVQHKNSQINIIHDDLKEYIGIDSVIAGKKISENWFPNIESDVFISHSHKDEKLAFLIKSEIEDNTDHKCFVDSSVWGSSQRLLEEIDKKYCKSGKTTYNYRQRNYSTSHVYLMLNVALQKMIFKSEFVIFLNTPESISVKETIETETCSPWIYSEISTVEMILNLQKEFKKYLNESKENFSDLKIKYPLDFKDFHEVNSIDDLLKILG